MRKGDQSKVFLSYPRGSGRLLGLFASEVAFLVFVECLQMIKPIVVVFCSIGGCCCSE